MFLRLIVFQNYGIDVSLSFMVHRIHRREHIYPSALYHMTDAYTSVSKANWTISVPLVRNCETMHSSFLGLNYS